MLGYDDLAKIILKAKQRLMSEPSVTRFSIVEYIEEQIGNKLGESRKKEFIKMIYD